jgi:hypothetical protein
VIGVRLGRLGQRSGRSLHPDYRSPSVAFIQNINGLTPSGNRGRPWWALLNGQARGLPLLGQTPERNAVFAS